MKTVVVFVQPFIVALLLPSCVAPLLRDAPSQDGPRLTGFRLDNGETLSGCPVSVTVEFAAPRERLAGAELGWWHKRDGRPGGRGLVILPIPASAFVGKASGEATASLMFWHPGTYSLSVQLTDVRGRRSNIEERFLVVYAQQSPPRPCRVS